MNKMLYFEKLTAECDAVAFRSLPDLDIPAGIAKELQVAKEQNKPIIELPSQILRRVIDVEQTREYLREIGQR